MKIQVFLPAILLIFAVVCAHFSGNDKAPFLVIFVAALNTLIAFSSIFAILLRKISLDHFAFLSFLQYIYFLFSFLQNKDSSIRKYFSDFDKFRERLFIV